MTSPLALPILLLALASPEPPDAKSIARRAIVVSAVYSLRLHPRATEPIDIEIAAGFERDRRRLLEWLDGEGLLSSATTWERKTLETKVGRLSVEDGHRVSVQAQTLAVLLFALGRLEKLPPWDGTVDRRAPRLDGLLPRPGAPTAKFVGEARLRDKRELSRLQDVAALWQWRSRTQKLIAGKRYPTGKAFERGRAEIRAGLEKLGMEPGTISNGAELLAATVRYSARWAYRDGMIATPIRDDFPARGKPYRDLTTAELAAATRVADTRAATIKWLVSGSASESDTR